MLWASAVPAFMLIPERWSPSAIICTKQCTCSSRTAAPLEPAEASTWHPARTWDGWAAQGSLLLPRCTELACSSAGAAPTAAGLVRG